MKKIVCTMASLLILASCIPNRKKDDFDYTVIRVCRSWKSCGYKVPGFEELSLNKKNWFITPLRSCVYGRDILL